MMCEGWKQVKLKDCALIVDSLHKTPSYSVSGYPMVRVTDINGGFLDLTRCVKVNRESFEQYTHKHMPHKGDIIISRVGSYGVFSYVATDAQFCLGQNTAVICPRVEGKFLYYYLISPSAKKQIDTMAVGSTQKTVSLASIKEVDILLPRQEVQRAIAATLSCLDDKIELNNRMNKTLEEMAQAIYKSWFVDFEPFQGGEFVDSELGRIPKGWRVGVLDECIELYDYKRIPLSSRERASMDKLYPYYGATSLMDYVNDFIFDGVYVLLGEDGSVVDSEGYPILQYVWGKFWVNNHAHILKGRNGYDEQSIYMLLKNTNVQSIVTGAVQLKINQANLKSVRVLIPDESTLKRFNMMVFDVFQLKRQLREESDLLVSTRDILLPKLMSGEICVSALMEV